MHNDDEIPMQQVTTYQWAYDVTRKIDLCEEHAAHPTEGSPSLGRVLHGIHDGRCAACRVTSEASWHEQIKAAMVELYGSPCGADLDAVDLDDYRGMDPRDAAEKIMADVRESKAQA